MNDKIDTSPCFVYWTKLTGFASTGSIDEPVADALTSDSSTWFEEDYGIPIDCTGLAIEVARRLLYYAVEPSEMEKVEMVFNVFDTNEHDYPWDLPDELPAPRFIGGAVSPARCKKLLELAKEINWKSHKKIFKEGDCGVYREELVTKFEDEYLAFINYWIDIFSEAVRSKRGLLLKLAC